MVSDIEMSLCALSCVVQHATIISVLHHFYNLLRKKKRGSSSRMATERAAEESKGIEKQILFSHAVNDLGECLSFSRLMDLFITLFVFHYP